MRFFYGKLIGYFSGNTSRFKIQLIYNVFEVIIGLGNGCATEGIGFNNIGTSLEILVVNGFDNIRSRKRKQVVIAFKRMFMIFKPFTPENPFPLADSAGS
jgi:hypothetical protein